MTDLLTDLMHRRADTTAFEPPDLAAVTRAGERTLRRRRSLTAVGGAAAAAVVVAGLVAVLPGTDGAVDDDAVTPPAAAAAPLTWVEGSTLHVGAGSTVDLGREVAAYVRTDAGYVFVGRDDRVRSWVDGTSRDVGLAPRGDPRLVADPETSTVAFVDGGEGPAQVVVLDQVRDAVHVLPTEGTARLQGLDAGRAYWRDDRGIVSVEVDSGVPEVLDTRGGPDLTDVEGGVFATKVPQGSVVGDAPGEGVRVGAADGSMGVLSPDGRWYSSEGDEQAVFDTATGEQVRLDLAQQFATGYEWLDETTLAVLAADRAREDATAQLLTCTVPDGRCTMVADDLGTFTELQGEVELPVGQPTG